MGVTQVNHNFIKCFITLFFERFFFFSPNGAKGKKIFFSMNLVSSVPWTSVVFEPCWLFMSLQLLRWFILGVLINWNGGHPSRLFLKPVWSWCWEMPSEEDHKPASSKAGQTGRVSLSLLPCVLLVHLFFFVLFGLVFFFFGFTFDPLVYFIFYTGNYKPITV